MSDLSIHQDHSNDLRHVNDLKQMQRLMMSAKMQQALNLLQTPIVELRAMIEMYLEQNPILTTLQEDEDFELTDDENENSEDFGSDEEQELTFSDDDFSVLQRMEEDFLDFSLDGEQPNVRDKQLRTYIEQSIPSQPSLFEFLMQQAQESFEKANELAMAEAIIGELSEAGYLHTPLKEIAQRNNFVLSELQNILKKIQSFDPIGVGASSLQESLLIQLENQGKGNSLAFQIINHHFDDLLHNKIPEIQKGLKCSPKEIQEAIHSVISRLDIHPGLSYSKQATQHIHPDITLCREGDEWRITINDESVPTLRLNTRYLRMLHDEHLPAETREYIKKQLSSAKWLVKNLRQRNETLTKIVEALRKYQESFFQEPTGTLMPLTMKTIAAELGVNESTIARAISNKYLECPRGLVPLRMFFSNAYETANGDEISSRTVRTLLLEAIQKEDKRHPLSDAALAKCLKEKGIDCARRTIAKYRQELNLGNAHQRRSY